MHQSAIVPKFGGGKTMVMTLHLRRPCVVVFMPGGERGGKRIQGLSIKAFLVLRLRRSRWNFAGKLSRPCDWPIASF